MRSNNDITPHSPDQTIFTATIRGNRLETQPHFVLGSVTTIPGEAIYLPGRNPEQNEQKQRLANRRRLRPNWLPQI